MKSYYRRKEQCLDCNEKLEENVLEYSMDHFKMPLCRVCQKTFKVKSEKSTKDAVDLYIALKLRGVPAELEKFDGHKTIDIAVTEAMVNIEVDGGHHFSNPKQALADLKRTYYAFIKGYLTLRIPNTLIRANLEEAADYITEFLQESADDIDWAY